MSRSTWFSTLAGSAAGAYALHGLVTDTGAAGWINYLQQSIFGSYSMKLTVLALTFGVLAVVALAWGLASIGRRDEPAPIPAPQRPPHAAAIIAAPSTWKTFAQVFAGFTVITWAIGFGALWWNNRVDREDSAAAYEPVIASDTNPMPTAAGSHVALGGRLLRERVVEFRRGKSSSRSASYYLVPVVAPGWREGQPASFVIKVDRIESLANRISPQISLATSRALMVRNPAEPTSERWLGRVEGQVPVPAAQEFKKMGVPVAEEGRLVRWIPSADGKPAIRDRWAQDLEVTTYICAGLTVLYLLLFPLLSWSSNRAQRKSRSG